MTADRPTPHDDPATETLDGLNRLWDALATGKDAHHRGGAVPAFVPREGHVAVLSPGGTS